MAFAARIWPGFRRGWFTRRHIACLILLAFTAQSYITQTHIHGWAQATPASATAGVLNAAPPDHKVPLDQSHPDCPFCQAVAHAGVFAAPAPLVWIVPAIWFATDALAATTRPAGHTFAHIWQSRAPPRF